MGNPRHPEELKREIVDLMKRGARITDLIKEYKIAGNTIRGFPSEIERLDAKKSEYEAIKASLRGKLRHKPVTYESQQTETKHSGNVVLVIPDLHCPWEHQDALEFLKAVRAKYQPNIVVNLGDEVDFYGMSRFDHDPDVINPGGELSLAVKHLIPFYREFPDVLICQSNHTHRVHSKAQKAGLPSSTMKSIEEILKTPEGWKYKYCHTVDGVDYKHGTGKSGANAHINHTKATGRSTCIGHIHAYAGVNYLRNGLFAANFACLIDKSADCFKYASDMDDNIVLGCGIVIGGKEAYFIPLQVDENNRWVGHL